MRLRTALSATLAALVLLVAVPACSSLQQFANLRQIKLDLAGIEGLRLAGVDLSNVRRYDDLRTTDILRLSAAVAQGEMPLRMTLLVGAENPQENSVTAEVDLIKFFGNNTRQLVDLALALTAGQGGGVTSRVKVVARPTISTPLGPIRYPRPITLVNRDVTVQPR